MSDVTMDPQTEDDEPLARLLGATFLYALGVTLAACAAMGAALGALFVAGIVVRWWVDVASPWFGLLLVLGFPVLVTGVGADAEDAPPWVSWTLITIGVVVMLLGYAAL